MMPVPTREPRPPARQVHNVATPGKVPIVQSRAAPLFPKYFGDDTVCRNGRLRSLAMRAGLDGRVFISGVSSEVGKARTEIANDLGARGLLVKVQEEFRQEVGTATTLAKLDLYIRDCTAVIHIAGTRSGAFPGKIEAEPFRHILPEGVTRASYTQWEFHLARHHGRRLSIYLAKDYAPDKPVPTSADEDAASQAAHIALLEELDRDYFGTTDKLCRGVLREDWPPKRARTPNTLPYQSLGDFFKGREAFLETLRKALQSGGTQAAAVTGQALHGLGGVGKTRLAVEYAWAHAKEHSALLFIPAETPERLASSLAALAGPEILDLPEKNAPQDDIRIPAALGWLEHNPGWLIILDNIDDPPAAKAVSELLPKLRGGQVILTARYSNFPASIRRLELGVLEPEAALVFLMERTDGSRVASVEDTALAWKLAAELGYLPLGLEQAAAYIATQHISFARYLKLWREKREQVLGWFDRDQMSYNHDVGLAATWATSVEKLSPEARRLLERLAFLAPEPVPDFLLDVPVPGEAADYDAYAARAELFSYSLAASAESETAAAGFTVHRLVQDFTRREMNYERTREALIEVLGWVDAAVDGNPEDARTWPIIEPLSPHMLSAAEGGQSIGVLGQTSDLFANLGIFFHVKARFDEAERVLRCALAIREKIYGNNSSTVANIFNILANLLKDVNRIDEAEIFARRALEIDENEYDKYDPIVGNRLNNLASILQFRNRYDEAESLLIRSLVIEEKAKGPNHQDVANRLGNMALLLLETNRAEQAEPLIERSLQINEQVFGSIHPTVALCLNNLGGLYIETKRVIEAEQMFRRSLSINEELFGDHHPMIAICLSNICGALRSAGKFAEAEPVAKRALEIDKAILGENHPNFAIRLNGLAAVYEGLQRAAEAEPLYRRAADILTKSYGEDHPYAVQVSNNLASLIGKRSSS